MCSGKAPVQQVHLHGRGGLGWVELKERGGLCLERLNGSCVDGEEEGKREKQQAVGSRRENARKSKRLRESDSSRKGKH